MEIGGLDWIELYLLRRYLLRVWEGTELLTDNCETIVL